MSSLEASYEEALREVRELRATIWGAAKLIRTGHLHDAHRILTDALPDDYAPVGAQPPGGTHAQDPDPDPRHRRPRGLGGTAG